MTFTNVNTMLSDELADLDAQRENGGERGDSRSKTRTSPCSNIKRNVFYTTLAIKERPWILVRAILVFLIVCSVGMIIIFLKDKINKEALEEEALDLAIETGRWFCKFYVVVLMDFCSPLLTKRHEYLTFSCLDLTIFLS